MNERKQEGRGEPGAGSPGPDLLVQPAPGQNEVDSPRPWLGHISQELEPQITEHIVPPNALSLEHPFQTTSAPVPRGRRVQAEEITKPQVRPVPHSEPISNWPRGGWQGPAGTCPFRPSLGCISTRRHCKGQPAANVLSILVPTLRSWISHLE